MIFPIRHGQQMFLSVNPAVFSADGWTAGTLSLVQSHVQGWDSNFGRQDGSRDGPGRVFRGKKWLLSPEGTGDVSKDKMPWSPQAPEVVLGGSQSPAGHRTRVRRARL